MCAVNILTTLTMQGGLRTQDILASDQNWYNTSDGIC